MLSAGPGAPRLSPSQDLHLKTRRRFGNLHYRQCTLNQLIMKTARRLTWPLVAQIQGSVPQKGVPGMKPKRKLPFDPRVFLSKVNGGRTVSGYRKDEIVFSQGDVANAVFYIQNGKIKLTVISERGKEAVVGILGPGHFFGEGCLNGHALRVTTATAIDQCLITGIPKAAMIATMHDEPEFSELFMADLLNRNSRIEEDLIDQLFNSSEKRLARVLLLLANFGKEGTPEPIVGTFSQETLAEMIGTTRSRVSHFMNKFRKLGYIEYNGKLEIHNSLLNVVLYDKPEIRTKDTI
jgi:CRP/FNR family cyclic AMP-dependent transcriptional regulator